MVQILKFMVKIGLINTKLFRFILDVYYKNYIVK